MRGEKVESMSEDNSQEAYLRLPIYLSICLSTYIFIYLSLIYLSTQLIFEPRN